MHNEVSPGHFTGCDPYSCVCVQELEANKQELDDTKAVSTDIEQVILQAAINIYAFFFPNCKTELNINIEI